MSRNPNPSSLFQFELPLVRNWVHRKIECCKIRHFISTPIRILIEVWNRLLRSGNPNPATLFRSEFPLVRNRVHRKFRGCKIRHFISTPISILSEVSDKLSRSRNPNPTSSIPSLRIRVGLMDMGRCVSIINSIVSYNL